MVAHLPDHKPIPWPRPLHWLTGHGKRLLGGQRTAALKVGLLGAYVGRGLMLVLASFVVHNPWLKILGAAYLLKLAAEHLGQDHHEDDDNPLELPRGKGFWSVVLAVELADLAFSLDNVVAAVALSSELWVVMLGVALGIVTMRFAAGVFSHLVDREPVLIQAAYVLILNISVELLIEEITGAEIHDMVKFVVSVTTLSLAVAYAHFPPLQALNPVFCQLARVLGVMNRFFDLLLSPFSLLSSVIVDSL
ncbi:MAG TPA: DUF475 domain-containing protein, partial [Anaerolineae bacterium]|nr:DUF475 domain-containing protein [Anaerolineae bacterium]